MGLRSAQYGTTTPIGVPVALNGEHAARMCFVPCPMSHGCVQVELVSRAATLLVRLHHAQLVATAAARVPLLELRLQLRGRTQQLKDRMGFNLAALSHLQRGLKLQHGISAM